MSVMDFPAAWAYIRQEHPDPADHHPSCSWAQTSGALLCDCDVLWDEYVRRGGSDPRAHGLSVLSASNQAKRPTREP